MRRLSWERTFTISPALTLTHCAGLASAARLPLNRTDTTNENCFKVERQIGPSASFSRLLTVPTDVHPTWIKMWERGIGAAPARSSPKRLILPLSKSS